MLNIRHKNFEAIILKQGAQLIHFQPVDKKRVLWHTDLKNYIAGKPFRGGVPVCWPWFGKAKTPAHGFARIMEWELVSQKEDEENVELEWRLQDSPKTREIWDHPFAITLFMKLGKTLQMRLAVDTDTQTTGALHTYFYINDLADVEVLGLGGSYIDSLDKNSLHVSEDEVLKIKSETDRIYPSASNTSMIREKEREVRVLHQNYSDIVLWNPYKDLPDMSCESYKNMLCVESARISVPLKNKDFLGFEIL